MKGGIIGHSCGARADLAEGNISNIRGYSSRRMRQIAANAKVAQEKRGIIQTKRLSFQIRWRCYHAKLSVIPPDLRMRASLAHVATIMDKPP